jgi:hypothetical protein
MGKALLEFKPFDKIGRLKRMCTITEKLDGTNAQVQFDDDGNMLVGSRKREIFPEGSIQGMDGNIVKGTDNFAFAHWCTTYRKELYEYLGKGCHYGEWVGRGIQRGYNFEGKKFFLFNNLRHDEVPKVLEDAGLGVVPTLYNGDFDTGIVDEIMDELLVSKSLVDGVTVPEGIVVYHHGTRTLAKCTYDYDKKGKGT